MKTMPKDIQARINQAAHRLGQKYAAVIRDMLTTDLQRMTNEGASHPKLSLALCLYEKKMSASSQRKPEDAELGLTPENPNKENT